MHRRRFLAAPATALALALAACGGGDTEDREELDPSDVSTTTSTTEGAAEATTTTTAEAAAEPITILVTNDDGVGAPGIDALVESLVGLDGIELVVVAPAEEQSGQGGNTSPEPPEAFDTELTSGHPAVAVEGTPADSVAHALDVVFAGTLPDLVISGINSGQNLGPAVDLSGTIGAARVAARQGIPALAVSQGFSADGGFDFDAGVAEVLEWLEENLDDLRPGTVANLNIPTCLTGDRGDVVEVEPEVGGDLAEALNAQDCSATDGPPPATEIAAFLAGYPTLSEDVGVG